MLLNNSTEAAVRAAIRTMRDGGRSDDSRCRCALCQADILALSLGSLDPHYYTSPGAGKFASPSVWESVAETVALSADRVAMHPKHCEGDGGVASARLRLVNFNHLEGVAVIESLAEESTVPCTCGQCRTEALAYALNRYPPRYGIERNNEIRLPAKEREAIRRDLKEIVGHAVIVVARSPRHIRDT